MGRHSRQVSFMWYWRKRLASKAHSAHDTVKSRYSEPQINDFFDYFENPPPNVHWFNVKISKCQMFQNNLSNFITLVSQHFEITNCKLEKLLAAV